MTKLLVSLLLLPLLLGPSVQRTAPAEREAHRTDAISGTNAAITQPALPGIAGPGELAGTGPASSWRTPNSAARTTAVPPSGVSRVHGSRAHLSALELRYLEYCYVIGRARANAPITFGNPPPASHT